MAAWFLHEAPAVQVPARSPLASPVTQAGRMLLSPQTGFTLFQYAALFYYWSLLTAALPAKGSDLMQVTGDAADTGLLQGELLPSSGLRLQVFLCQGRAASHW